MPSGELTLREKSSFRFQQLASLQGLMTDDEYLRCSRSCHNFREAVERGDEEWIEQTDREFGRNFHPILHKMSSRGLGSGWRS